MYMGLLRSQTYVVLALTVFSGYVYHTAASETPHYASEIFRRAGETDQKCWKLRPWEDLVILENRDQDHNDPVYQDDSSSGSGDGSDGSSVNDSPNSNPNINLRDLDWSGIDQQGGINITHILRSRDFDGLDTRGALHEIEALIS